MLRAGQDRYRPQILISRLFVNQGELRFFMREKTIIESTMLTRRRHRSSSHFVVWISLSDEANLVTRYALLLCSSWFPSIIK
ncbi:hypothetical protein Y032_0170g257 [Ancylostoma ceylanicum]|uniref:Uncharacterized protein n=1 Tax=Ancylostoma ceylanicum TaxID=53326 RepID=A0A016SVP2_9BILA|nr:hypothetical protein Y032_0170g257 [Ancylostoma ceylanicum]